MSHLSIKPVLSIPSILLCLALCNSTIAQTNTRPTVAPITLTTPQTTWQIIPETLSLTAETSQAITTKHSHATVQFSNPIAAQPITDLRKTTSSATWTQPGRNLHFRLETIPNNGLQITIASVRDGAGYSVGVNSDNLASPTTSSAWLQDIDAGRSAHATGELDAGRSAHATGARGPQEFAWPRIPLAPADHIIWPLGEGLLFPANSPFWQDEIFTREWPAAESLSLPLAGIARDNQVATVISETPLRHTITFTTATAAATATTAAGTAPAIMQLTQQFSPVSTAPLTLRFYLDETTNPLTPAIHFRDYLHEINDFKTLGEKAAKTTSVALLKGAPFVYLWDHGYITQEDILPKKWQDFATQTIADADAGKPIAAFLKTTFTPEQWKSLQTATTEKWVYAYLKQQIADGLSAALASDEFPVPVGDSATANDHSSATIMQRRAQALAGAYPGIFRPVDQWGGGLSNRMIDQLADAGLKYLRLCTDGQSALKLRPDVAQNAINHGWLIGTYDSYHSVHSPDLPADKTWETAQMTRDLFEDGAVIGANGKPLTGFRGLGHKLNPVVARSFMQKRVTDNMAAVPYNYYFIDCDATGEVFDDYSTSHPLSKEADIAERLRRLRWIGKQFNAVVGSEGGKAFAASSIAVAEGVFAPFFGWDDPAMKDKKSKYYRGAYYPPEKPAVFFKPIPLKDRHCILYYDPGAKIPLYAKALHDSIEVAPHWNNEHFKYEGLEHTRELIDLLYLAPPLYHLNVQEFSKRKAAIMRFYKIWSPVHHEFGFARLSSYRVQSPGGADQAGDRAVQTAIYTNVSGETCEITVNFGTEEQTLDDGTKLSGGTARVVAGSLWSAPQYYGPAE